MGHNDVWVEAAREGAALAPARAYGVLRITGKDRQEFVHSYTTNEIKGLGPGQGCTAAISSWKGTVTDHVRILCRPHELLVIGTYGRQKVVKAALEKYILGVDVQIEDLTGRICGHEIGGPAALKILAAARDLPLNAHRAVRFAPPLCDLADSDNPLAEAPDPGDPLSPLDGEEGECPEDTDQATTGIVIRTSGFCGAGAMVLVPIQADVAMRDRLRRMGATAIGPEAWELIRIEEGIPEFGRDYSEDTNVWEARLDRSVSMQKGCYLGQEIVARLYNYGKVQRYLVGIRADGTEPIAPGTPVQLEGTEIGKVTSAHPDLAGGTAGLAMVKASAARPGERVSIAGRIAILEDRPFWSAAPATLQAGSLSP